MMFSEMFWVFFNIFCVHTRMHTKNALLLPYIFVIKLLVLEVSACNVIKK